MPLPLPPSDARLSRNVAAGSIVGALLLASQLMLGLDAWGDTDIHAGVCRNAHSGPGCAVGPMPPGPNPGNNSGRNDNPKAHDCGSMKQQMGELCQKYHDFPTDRDEIRGQINNLQRQWSGSSCGNGGGLGCGGGGGPVQSSPGKSTGSSAGDTSSGDSVGGGGSGTGSGSTQGSASTGAGQKAKPGTGVLEIVRGAPTTTTKSPPNNNGFVAIPVGVVTH